MGKELDDLRRFKAELNEQDQILKVAGNDEVRLELSSNLKRLFVRIGEAFPELANLSKSFSANSQAIVLRSQIATANAAVAAQIEAWEHILDRRVSPDKAATVIRIYLEKGRELEMEPTGSNRNVDFLKSNREQWIAETINNLEKVFVSDIHARRYSKAVETTIGHVPHGAWGLPDQYGEVRATIRSGVAYLESLQMDLYLFGEDAGTPVSAGSKIFIGHGRSLVWLQLKDFLGNRLHLTCEEFNEESPAGIATVTRLEEMLKAAQFAFLVMTAEDLHHDDSAHARENVIHEAGLFQGRLGFKRAIILFEHGCTEFSNIHGLTTIRFPKGNVAPAFEEIRHVLEREGVIAKLTR